MDEERKVSVTKTVGVYYKTGKKGGGVIDPFLNAKIWLHLRRELSFWLSECQVRVGTPKNYY